METEYAFYERDPKTSSWYRTDKKTGKRRMLDFEEEWDDLEDLED